MAKLAVAVGIDPTITILESESMNTWSNVDPDIETHSRCQAEILRVECADRMVKRIKFLAEAFGHEATFIAAASPAKSCTPNSEPARP